MGGWSHRRGRVCKLKSAHVENWGPFFPSNSQGRETPPVCLYFRHKHIQNKHTLSSIWLSLYLCVFCRRECSNGWVGRLRGLAEIIDNPPADLTVNQLIPWGAQGMDRKLSFCLLSSHSLFLLSFLLLLHLSIYLIPPPYTSPASLTEHKHSP